MALTIPKMFIIIVALINLILISVFTMLGKFKIAVALSVLEAFIVTSSSYFN